MWKDRTGPVAIVVLCVLCAMCACVGGGCAATQAAESVGAMTDGAADAIIKLEDAGLDPEARIYVPMRIGFQIMGFNGVIDNPGGFFEARVHARRGPGLPLRQFIEIPVEVGDTTPPVTGADGT